MEAGDISNEAYAPDLWDWKLFLNIKYEKLFEFFVKHNLIFAAKLFCKIDQDILEAYQNSHVNTYVVLTEPKLEKLFSFAEVILTPSYAKIGSMDFNMLYTDNPLLLSVYRNAVKVGKNITKDRGMSDYYRIFEQ